MKIEYAKAPGAGGRCPRCDKPWSGHEFCSLTSTGKNPGKDQSMFLCDALGEVASADDRMLGVLRAVAGGLEIKLVACSGSGSVVKTPRGSGWQIANNRDYMKGRQNGSKYLDIYGREFDLSECVTLPDNDTWECAALKLVYALGVIAKKQSITSYSSIAMMEERTPGWAKTWKGRGTNGAANNYMAHSCARCDERLPYFLCSLPNP